MKEALFWNKKKDKVVQCVLCPRNCVIAEGKRGFCGVRENQNGKLISLVYGKAVSVNVDPIEKKPLFHFLPGSRAFSFGTVGCNLKCQHCQNWEISQCSFEEGYSRDLEPAEIVEQAEENECESIAYTYNDPTVFFEYALDTAKLAKKKGIKNVIVHNGFINKEPLLEWCKVMDAANVDYKGDDNFYRKITTAWLEPVQQTIKTLYEKKVWDEITNLLIPTLNDKESQIKEMCTWIKDNVGLEIPLHFSRFFPYYKLNKLPPTPADSLLKARNIALKTGFKFVYVGNVYIEGAEDTYCPKCKEAVITREGFSVVSNKIKDGKCKCGEKIAGVWK